MGKIGGRFSRPRQRGIYSLAFFRPPRALFLWVLVVNAVMLAAPHRAFASGEERTTVGDDLVIRTDTRWAGGTLGGYLPVRVEIANQGPARELGARSHARRPGARGDRQAGRWRGRARNHAFHAFHSAHGVRTGAAPRLRPARRAGIARASHWEARGFSAGGQRLRCLWSRPGRSIVRVTSRRPADRPTRHLARRTRPRLRKWFHPTACPIRGSILAVSISSPFRATTSRTSSRRYDRRS